MLCVYNREFANWIQGVSVEDLKGWPEPYIHGVISVFLAGKSTNIRSNTVYIYGAGKLDKFLMLRTTLLVNTPTDVFPLLSSLAEKSACARSAASLLSANSCSIALVASFAITSCCWIFACVL